MNGKMKSVVLLSMLVLSSGSAVAKPVAQKNLAMSIADLSSFTVNPSELKQRLDRALTQNPNSVPLNFLRGLIYDASSVMGSEGRQLARVGYMTALRSDPTYWPANYQLGLLAMEDADPVLAERSFIAAAVYADDEPQIFYALARASYCSGNIGNARLALERAIALQAPNRDEDFVTAALVTAATGDKEGAQRWLDRVSLAAASSEGRYLRGRLAKLTHSNVDANPGTMPSVSADAVSAPAVASDRKMAIVDVVIIRRQEGRSTSNGINLMDALTLQFGSKLINSERTTMTDRLSSSTTSDAVTTVQNVNLAIPSVTYSLNIANAAGSNSSIDAHETLLVYNGVTSKVFSGNTLTFATSGQLNAQSFTKEVGFSLAVTPKFIAKDSVSLTIFTGLETFDLGRSAGSFNEAVQTEKSSSEITVDMNFGETVLVSGGRFENFQSTRSSTPLLGKVPLIGNLFSNRRNRYVKDDLLIILSVRRDGGRQDRKRAEEIELIGRVGSSLWQKLGVANADQVPRIGTEEHRPYYDLENAGRGFNRIYLNRIGIESIVQQL